MTTLPMSRRPATISCPACKYRAEPQPVFTEDIRTFQHFICNTPTCPVGSFRIEWRTDE